MGRITETHGAVVTVIMASWQRCMLPNKEIYIDGRRKAKFI